MAEFRTPTDIGNRALQHCGAELMDPVLGFTENSKVSGQISFVYGKARRAELEQNFWTFAIKKVALRAIDSNAMLLQPSLWASGTTYFVGSIVNDGSGTNWISNSANNLGNQPQNTTAWDPYFGPLTVTLYDPTAIYFTGELVYTAAGDGTYNVYQSVISGNSDVPGAATAYSATTTYFQNQVVTFNSVAYMSLINLNIGNEPDLAPAAWSSVTTYSIGQKVYNPVDGLIYTSTANSNLNHNPATDAGAHWSTANVLCPWTAVFVGGSGSLNWLLIGGAAFPFGVALTTLNLRYPVGSGPASQYSTSNVFRLPAGYLKDAPQDPKAGSVSQLGAPTNSLYNDWVFENELIVTRENGPIVLRFVADMQNVSRMQTLFCECLAARIAEEVCEPLTNSAAKLVSIRQQYKDARNKAVIANFIEAGAEEPPLDDFIACRA